MAIKIIFKELKNALGLGEYQVPKKEIRIKNSICIAIIVLDKNEAKNDYYWRKN